MVIKNIWQRRIPTDQSVSALKPYKRIAFKTNTQAWVNTQDPVILVFSVHSSFHEGETGLAKANAFVSTIKANVKGKITVLFAEKAHAHVESLKYENNMLYTIEQCSKDAQALISRCSESLAGLEIKYWGDLITQDPEYQTICESIMHLYQTDEHFRILLAADAESTYTAVRQKKFPDKELFIIKTIQDLLEQAAEFCITAKKGYRFKFYPGRPYASLEYFNSTFLKDEVTWVSVFLSLEKR